MAAVIAMAIPFGGAGAAHGAAGMAEGEAHGRMARFGRRFA